MLYKNIPITKAKKNPIITNFKSTLPHKVRHPIQSKCQQEIILFIPESWNSHLRLRLNTKLIKYNQFSEELSMSWFQN